MDRIERTDRLVRIVLADDHPVVRIGVRNMLSANPGFEVVGEASDGDEAITQTSCCSMCKCPACQAWKPCGRS